MAKSLTGPLAKHLAAHSTLRSGRTPGRPRVWLRGWSQAAVYPQTWTLVACSRWSPGPSTETVRLAVVLPRTRRRRLRGRWPQRTRRSRRSERAPRSAGSAPKGSRPPWCPPRGDRRRARLRGGRAGGTTSSARTCSLQGLLRSLLPRLALGTDFTSTGGVPYVAGTGLVGILARSRTLQRSPPPVGPCGPRDCPSPPPTPAWASGRAHLRDRPRTLCV